MANQPNPYEGRWRWWYPAIADWMIRNPGRTFVECAAALDKHPNTIGFIVATDLFKDYFAKRREEWRQQHDHSIVSKTTELAELGLDLMIENMRTKRDKIPFRDLSTVTDSALERLGYGQSAAPAVQVNNYGNAQQIIAPVSISALEEARMAVRQVEEMHRRGLTSTSVSPPLQIESQPQSQPESQEDDTELRSVGSNS